MSRDYLATMIAMAESRWAEAGTLAGKALTVARTPSVMRINAATSLASALAAQGKTAAADSLLENMVAESRGASARWYERARLALALSQRTVPLRRNLLASDTSSTAAHLRALWNAVAGDTVSARLHLDRVRRTRDSAETIIRLTQAWIDLAAGQPQASLHRLSATAREGEHDPVGLDRPDNFLLRWTVAEAYERAGKPDSAIAFLRLLAEPTRMPPMQMALRGFLSPAAELKIQQLQGRR
jgi:hypothetical protein